MRSAQCYAVVMVAIISAPVTVWAELPRLESIAIQLKDDLKSQLDGATTVVAARQIGKKSLSWAVHEALANEIAGALRNDQLDVIPAAFDHRMETLGDSKVEFSSADLKRVQAVDRTRLVGIHVDHAQPPRLKTTLWDVESGKELWSKTIEVRPEDLQMEGNIPELNHKVVAFCRANFDKKVGEGICAELAGESLAAAGAKRSGVYTWGRELNDQEPLIPGDILQMELIEMKSPKFSRNFHHHTVVVEEVRADSIVVLQQNVAPKGKIVQRDIWPVGSFKRGYLVAFRPWSGSSPLPAMSPRRRLPPTIVRKGTAIDLLHSLSPRMDSVKGIWFIEEGTLRPNRDNWARLQVPVTPPDRYSLRLKVKRLVGKDQLGIGLIVGGRQTMLAIDAYGGTVSGLHLVDGKTVKSNPTTFKGSLLPEDKFVSLRVKVAPDSVVGEADGKPFLQWRGDAGRLSQDEKYAMPRQDWLFLASWNCHFSISEYWLDDESTGK